MEGQMEGQTDGQMVNKDGKVRFKPVGGSGSGQVTCQIVCERTSWMVSRVRVQR